MRWVGARRPTCADPSLLRPCGTGMNTDQKDEDDGLAQATVRFSSNLPGSACGRCPSAAGRTWCRGWPAGDRSRRPSVRCPNSLQGARIQAGAHQHHSGPGGRASAGRAGARPPGGGIGVEEEDDPAGHRQLARRLDGGGHPAPGHMPLPMRAARRPPRCGEELIRITSPPAPGSAGRVGPSRRVSSPWFRMSSSRRSNTHWARVSAGRRPGAAGTRPRRPGPGGAAPAPRALIRSPRPG